MSGAEWLTVKQFAVASSCTTQAVYKQLATRLQPYVKRENGRTYIHSAALDATGLHLVDNPVQVDNQLQTVQLDALREQISRQSAELTDQRAALDSARTELDGARLDRERLTAELAAAIKRADDAEARERSAADAAAERERTVSAQLSEALRALTAAQQHAAELTSALSAAQSLHAGTIRGQLDTAAGRPADVQSDGARSTVRTDADGPKPAGADQQPRRGLFARLFGKNK